MKKKNLTETDLLIRLIEETIMLRCTMEKLHRKIHSKYYELIGLLIKESRGRRILHNDEFLNTEFPTNGVIVFD
jgi:hypothetical protein